MDKVLGYPLAPVSMPVSSGVHVNAKDKYGAC